MLLKLKRDEGHDQEMGQEIFDDMININLAGGYVVLMSAGRSKEQTDTKAESIDHIQDYQHESYPEDGSIVFRECFGYGPARCSAKRSSTSTTSTSSEPRERGRLWTRRGNIWLLRSDLEQTSTTRSA